MLKLKGNKGKIDDLRGSWRTKGDVADLIPKMNKYEGEPVMMVRFNDIIAVMWTKYLATLHVHFCSHSLILDLGHAFEAQHMRNCICSVKTVEHYFMLTKRTTFFNRKK